MLRFAALQMCSAALILQKAGAVLEEGGAADEISRTIHLINDSSVMRFWDVGGGECLLMSFTLINFFLLFIEKTYLRSHLTCH